MSRLRWTRPVAGLAALVLLVSASSCSKEIIREGGATVVIIGNRLNASPPNVEKAAKQIYQGIDRGDRIIIVAESGTPAVSERIDTATCPEVESEPACTNDRKILKNAFVQAFGQHRATAGEASLFKSLKLARDEIKDVEGPRQIVVVDSGVDTASPLSMVDLALLDWDTKQVTDQLRRSKSLPDLTGIDVYLHGVGAVATPQDQLSDLDLDKLAAFWFAVLQSAGATLPQVSDAGRAKDAFTASPTGGKRIDLNPALTVTPAERKPVPPPKPCRKTELNDGQLGFKSNVATFYHKDRAEASVKPVADMLKKSGVNVVLTGTTAYAEAKSGNPISNDRAEAVRDILVDFGVPRTKILTQGVGNNFPGWKDPKGDALAEITMRRVIFDPTCPPR